MSLVYDSPFGHGKRFLTSSNGWVSRLAGGWQIAGTGQWSAGSAQALPGNVMLLKDPHQSASGTAIQQNWGDEVVRGWNQCVAQRSADGSVKLLANAVSQGCTEATWVILPSYAPRMLGTSDARLKTYTYPVLDMTMSKSTRINERLQRQFRIDAFNAPNSVGRAVIDTTPASNTFGQSLKTNSRNGTYRQLPMSLKLLF